LSAVYGFLTDTKMLLLLTMLYLVFPAAAYVLLFSAGWAAAWVYRGFLAGKIDGR